MKSFFAALVLLFSVQLSQAQFYPGDCATLLKIDSASVEELAKEYHRLKSAKIVACDTNNSTFHNIMKAIGKGAISEKMTQERYTKLMGEVYWQGTAEQYENNKVTLVRGKMVGAILPPMFEIPGGDSYVLYQWRKKDLMILAFKAGVASDVSWYKK
jgi:hypothetical protein